MLSPEAQAPKVISVENIQEMRIAEFRNLDTQKSLVSDDLQTKISP
jgi:hypothetical protein